MSSAALKRQLGFWDSIAINIGIVIGVGIFRVPSEVAKYVHSPEWMITAWIFLIGIVLVLPFGGMGLRAIEWHALTNWQWCSIVFVIVCTTFLTYLFNMIGIHYLSPTIASSYIYFQPMLAGTFAFLFSQFLGCNFTGDITWAKVFCTCLIFLGVYLVTKSDNTIKAER